MDMGIIGGGAAGLFAAWTAAGLGDRVTLLERGPRVGKKLLLTGNGRCNLSNRDAENPERYHGSVDPRPALTVLPPEALEASLASLGLSLVWDSAGRAYPRSGQAATVLDLLREGIARRGVEVCTDARVTELRRRNGAWQVTAEDGAVRRFHRVLFCPGGCAAPATGSDGTAMKLLTPLGHSWTALTPGLAPILTDPAMTRAAAGLRAPVEARLLQNGREIARRQGELQITRTGALSGICLFDLCRYAPAGGQLSLNLLPGLDREQALDLLSRRRDCPPEDRLEGLMNKRIGQMLCRRERDPRRLVTLAMDWRLPVRGTAGFDQAQVTVGGIPGDQVDPRTLASRRAPDLYFCGEVLDLDGDCGGFNLHWAFASGALAARCGREGEKT